ncbi:BclA C-terminal domain-containing protein [Amphibacillus marinus]|uniref:BclA C-terminal domain-containing protein n=1 Tax=Amphibacillus marinus TaxID=872970 RepID=UPI001FE16861|nr:hypothetical protein [Amphibacillus marinus]
MTNNINFNGPLGNCCPDNEPASSVTIHSMYASNTIGTAITVLLGGATNITLPSNQSLDGFIANGTNTIFTIPETGRYYLTYQINTTASLGIGAGSRLLRNGSTAIPGSIVRPIVSTATFNNDLITNFTAGNTVSLQLFSSILLTATLLSTAGSVGAALTIIRIE